MGEFTNSVVRMAAGFFFVFMAYNTAQALETTVLSDKTLAYSSLGLIYAAFCATAVVAPKIVDSLGPRMAMALGAVPYVLMVFANAAPSYYLLLPASAGVGIGAGVLWTGQGIYMSRCAIREAAATGEPVDTVTSRLNSLFWTAFQFNAAVGLVVSSIVLQSIGKDELKDAVRYMFIGFGAVGCGGVGILLMVKPAPPLAGAGAAGAAEGETRPLTAGPASAVAAPEEDEADKGKSSSSASPASRVSFLDTLRLLGSSRAMQLLVPLIFYNGVSLGFNGGAFPLLYQDTLDDNGDVTTARLLSPSRVGYQAACFYLVNSCASFAWGRLIPRTGRRVLFLFAAVAAGTYFTLVLLLAQQQVWPAHESPAAYALVFGTTLVFAAGDSVLESQLPAVIQSPTFFPRERERDAANSILRMWMSLGYAVAFTLGATDVPPTSQVAFLLPLLAFAMVCLWYCDKHVRAIEAPPGAAALLSDAAAGGKRSGASSDVSSSLLAAEEGGASTLHRR